MGATADNAGSTDVKTPAGRRVELYVGRQDCPSGGQWHTATTLGEHLTHAAWQALCVDAANGTIPDAVWRATLANLSPAFLARAEARAIAVGRPVGAVVDALRADCARWPGYVLPPA